MTMSLHQKRKKKKMRAKEENCFRTPPDFFFPQIFFSALYLATLQGVTMPPFLCIITEAAKATNGPHTDDSCHRFTKSATKEEQVHRTVLTTRQKKKKKHHLLFHLSCFFMYKAAQTNILYKGRKRRIRRQRSRTLQHHRQREPSHRPSAPVPTAIVK